MLLVSVFPIELFQGLLDTELVFASLDILQERLVDGRSKARVQLVVPPHDAVAGFSLPVDHGVRTPWLFVYWGELRSHCLQSGGGVGCCCLARGRNPESSGIQRLGVPRVGTRTGC